MLLLYKYYNISFIELIYCEDIQLYGLSLRHY